MQRKTIINIIGIFISLLFTLFFLDQCLKANRELTDGRWALHMDERLFFDNVNRIIKSDSIVSFTKEYIGEDQRYGRIVYLGPALLSKVFNSAKLSSETIFLTRMFNAVVLSLSYIFLLRLFFSNWFIISAILGIFYTFPHYVRPMDVLPYAVTYATEPKPEPLLLFFLASFFYFSIIRKKNWGWHWLFMGLALGTKLSALPLVAFFLFRDFLNDRNISITKHSPFRKAMGFFLLGFTINVPCILIGKIKQYLFFMKANAKHGLDDPSVWFLDWIKLSIQEYFFSNWMGIAFWLLLFVVLILMIIELSKMISKPLTKKSLLDSFKIYFEPIENQLFIISSLSLFPIFISVKRLWGNYTFLGFVFFTITLVYFAIQNFRSSQSTSTIKNLIGKSSLLIAALLIVNVPFVFSVRINSFTKLATRTQTDYYKNIRSQHDFIKNILEKFSDPLSSIDKAYISPELPTPENFSNIEFEEFWGPFKYWQNNYKYVINIKAGSEEPDSGEIANTRSQVDYQDARALHLQHAVISPNETCPNTPCYYLLAQDTGVRIYARKD